MHQTNVETQTCSAMRAKTKSKVCDITIHKLCMRFATFLFCIQKQHCLANTTQVEDQELWDLWNVKSLLFKHTQNVHVKINPCFKTENNLS